MLPSAKPAGEKLQHKLLPNFPALPAHAWLGHQTQRTGTACSVALQKDNIFFSLHKMHFIFQHQGESGMLEDLGLVCVFFSTA